MILVEGIAKDVSVERRDDWHEQTLEQRTGDAPFDAKFRVKGNSLTCRSLLDAPAREALREAFEAFPGLVVNAGVVSWNGRPADVEGASARLLDLASKLLPPDLIAGLEKNALGDPSPANRQRSLDLLVRRFPDAPETIEVVAPDGRGMTLERGDRADFRFTRTDQVGVYEVRADGRRLGRFAVSLLDDAESDVTPRGEIRLGDRVIRSAR